MAQATQTGPIVVYGATGFTGKLVAEELRRREANFVIAGRNAGKLRDIAAGLGEVPFTVAPLDDPAALRALLEPAAAVIACAGPFIEHGEPVVAAAAETGTHYVDTTGEQPFMQMVFARYGKRAADNGAVLVTGMGFDYVPGDLIASLAAAGMGPLEEIVIAYWVRGFAATRGTTRSTLEIMSGGDEQWRDGGWRPSPRSVDGGRWDFGAPIGERRMLRYPAGEQITVPRHVETANVRTLLSGMMLPERLMPLVPLTMPVVGLALRTPLRRAAEALIDRMPEGPSEEDRRKARFTISCEARAVGGGSRRAKVSGPDVYGLTAVTTVEGALRAADPGFDRSGALAPAQAFDPASFLDSLAGFGVSYEVEAAPQPVAAAR
jgi:short subunit dehydrogenase-like uncharacterized protein